MSFRWSVCLISLISSFACAQVAQPFSRSNIPAACSTISAHVLTTDGQPLSGATVEIRAIGEVAPAEMASFARSNGSSRCAAPGWYRVTARYGKSESSQEVNVSPGQVQMVTLRLDANDTAGAAATVSAEQLRVPEKARRALDKAQERLAKKDHEGALRYIAEALKAYPESSEAYRLRGLVSLMDGHPAESINDLDRAVKLDSHNVMARVILGAALNAMSKFKEAVASINAALPMAPQSWQAQYELAKAYAGVGDMSQAISAIDRAIAINPSFAPMRYVRAQVLIHTHQYAAAVRDLRQFLQAAPSGPDTERARQLLASVQGK